MTRDKWLASEGPDAMLCFLGSSSSDRKLRLFSCACCRRIWRLSKDDQVLRADVVGVERFLEGEIASLDDENSYRDSYTPLSPGVREAFKAAGTLGWSALSCAKACSRNARLALLSRRQRRIAGREAEAQAHLLRDIFQPFHVPRMAPAWMAWEGGTVARLAEAAYRERALPSGHLDAVLLGVLADALEEVGCDDEEMLTHLRQPGPHVRGCWPVDRLLGKE